MEEKKSEKWKLKVKYVADLMHCDNHLGQENVSYSESNFIKFNDSVADLTYSVMTFIFT